MNQPSLYHRANEVQRRDAEQIIKEYSNILQWRQDGCDTLLDIGSGSGDVLMDFIYTIMPPKFKRIVGSDISPEMVNYAKSFYQSKEKCDFKVLDIGTSDDIPNDMKEQFDHVTSFYCLHWVQNQRQALQNIYSLLNAEGGDCLLVFLAAHPIYDVYKVLSKSSKWSAYMKDLDRIISPFHFSKNPKFELSSLLKEAGFSHINVELKQKVYVFENLEILYDNFKAICPFLDRMPVSLHDTFMDDFINTFTSLDLQQDYDSIELDSKFSLPYKLFIAYAKKSPQNTKASVSEMITTSKMEKNFN